MPCMPCGPGVPTKTSTDLELFRADPLAEALLEVPVAFLSVTTVGVTTITFDESWGDEFALEGLSGPVTPILV